MKPIDKQLTRLYVVFFNNLIIKWNYRALEEKKT